MTLLLEPPGSLTPRQRALVLITILAVALTRVYALAQTLWDWDEVQFALGVREYSVGWPFHHPHPPGFPLYMLAANIVRPFTGSDFAACQTIVFLSACALFPLAFALARELRFPFATAYGGALLFVFLPNVWFYGGTAFSDIPGLASSLAAAFLLLRGCRGPRAYLGGAIVLGIAAGIRPQALLMGFAPFVIASWFQWKQSWRRVFAAGAIVFVIVTASYTGAAVASHSIEGYRAGITMTRDWVRKVDSFMSPGRPSLTTLMERYFVRPIVDGRRLPVVLSVLAGAGLLAGFFRSRMSVWLTVAIFFPFTLFAWLMLDFNSIHRYSTAYAFLWAILIAHAFGVLALPLARFAPLAQSALVVLLAARCAWWTLPALRDVRSTPSPPVAVLEWARANVSPDRTLWVDGSLAPWAQYFLEGRGVLVVTDRTKLQAGGAGELFIAEGLLPGAAATFRRPRERTWNIARRRYFETSAVALSNLWVFGDGWYSDETDGTLVWRWMGSRSEARLPPIGGRARLALTLGAAGGITPDVEVRLNEVVVGRFRLGTELEQHAWIVDARGDAPNRLVIVSSAAVNLAKQGLSHDTRDLSVQLTTYSWQPVR